MKADDEEDDQNISIGVARYPCMPSLVALQQMRNRLHLAYLGKKLMKWTAMATGREQRKIASEIHEVYDDFPKDIKNSFILLARCRYFCPNLNNIVTESVGNKASISISATTKSVAGVRVSLYQLEESDVDPFPHLGIEKGGQLVSETKKAWRDMLKRMILMLQLRNSFEMLDLANKAATKKMNVLGKLVIPKTTASIHYILSELEEKEREEFFRMKKILQIKEKMNGVKIKVNKNLEKCCCCGEYTEWQVPLTQNTEEIKLEEFTNQLKDVNYMTKTIDEQKLRFVENAENAKDQLENKILNVVCDKCKEKVKNELTSPNEILKQNSDKNIINKSVKIVTNIDEELGTFETEVDVITKIFRYKNEEGEICEEKKVIRIEKKIRNGLKVPEEKNDKMSYETMHKSSNNSSDSSNTSNQFANSKTVGVVNFENKMAHLNMRSKAIRSSHSEYPLTTIIKDLSNSNISIYNKSEILDIISDNLNLDDKNQSFKIDRHKILFSKTNYDMFRQIKDSLFYNIPSTSAENAFNIPSFYKYLKENWLFLSPESQEERNIENEVRIDIKKDLERSVSLIIDKQMSDTSNNSDLTDDEV